MTKNRSTRDEVWKLIDRDPSLKLDIERRLINARALARYCSESGIAGTQDAIISAIRRYPSDSLANKRYNRALEIISKSAISTKSHIASVALRKSSETQELLPKLFSWIDFERGETLRIVQGEESIKLIVDEKNLAKMLSRIPDRLVVRVVKGLSEINMHLHPEAVNTPGIIQALAGELMRNGVNICEITSCVPEMLVFVDEKDLLRAYAALFGLCH
jgi:aspartokinase